MIQNKIRIFLYGIATLLILASVQKVSATTVKEIVTIPLGDTSSFSPNRASGWTTISSYLNQDTPDSVDIEFILVLNPANGRMGGSTEKVIGTITNQSFIPKKNQKISYSLLPNNTWYLVIKNDGQCLLAQTKGSGVKQSALTGSPDLIPIKLKYKNN